MRPFVHSNRANPQLPRPRVAHVPLPRLVRLRDDVPRRDVPARRVDRADLDGLHRPLVLAAEEDVAPVAGDLEERGVDAERIAAVGAALVAGGRHEVRPPPVGAVEGARGLAALEDAGAAAFVAVLRHVAGRVEDVPYVVYLMDLWRPLSRGGFC